MFFSQFARFLKNNKILHTALGVIIATSMTELVTSLNVILLDPIIAKLFKIDLEKEVDVFGAKVKLGLLLVEFVNFLIVVFLVFIISRYIMKHKGALES